MRRFLPGLFALALLACDSEVESATDVFVSIDAMDTARAATSVRVQVERVVVEVPVESWPLELVVQPRDGSLDRAFTTRAWGMFEGSVVGAAGAQARFRKGERFMLEMVLSPGLDLGPPPDVNTTLTPGMVVVQPASEHDAGSDGPAGPDGSVAQHDGGPPGHDASTPDPDSDAGMELPPGALAFCDQVLAPATAWNDWFASCCLANERSSQEFRDIHGSFRFEPFQDDASCLAWMNRNVLRGKVTFQGERADECAEAILAELEVPEPPSGCPAAGVQPLELLRERGHGRHRFGQIPACRAAFAGTIPVHGACDDDAMCEADLMCLDGSCEAALGRGADCSAYPTGCGPDLHCVDLFDGGTVCQSAPASVLDGCEQSIDCEPGAQCTPSGISSPNMCVYFTGMPWEDHRSCSTPFECQGFCDWGVGYCNPFCNGQPES